MHGENAEEPDRRPRGRRSVAATWASVGLLSGVVTTVLALGLGTGDRRRCVASVLPSPGESLLIEIEGREFELFVRHPGADGRLGTDDDVSTVRDVRIPAGVPTRLRLRSADYLYSLSLPRLGLREVAVPELEFVLDLSVEEPGSFVLQGEQLCGFGHPRLVGELRVDAPEDYARWILERSPIEERP